MNEETFPVPVILNLSMPFGETLEIRSSKEIDEDVENDEEVEGVEYKIYWGSTKLPWHTKTRREAVAIAFGCQFGAFEMMRKT
jgi:hypothetical protein